MAQAYVKPATPIQSRVAQAALLGDVLLQMIGGSWQTQQSNWRACIDCGVQQGPGVGTTGSNLKHNPRAVLTIARNAAHKHQQPQNTTATAPQTNADNNDNDKQPQTIAHNHIPTNTID